MVKAHSVQTNKDKNTEFYPTKYIITRKYYYAKTAL